MPTTVTKTIANTSSPTTPDYSTLQAWEDASPANLVTSDQIWEGQCLDQGEFTSGTTLLTISGSTTDATRYKKLCCASGASFRDKSGVRTTALFYNSANGVALQCTAAYSNRAITIGESYVRVDGLQLKSTSAGGAISGMDNATISNVIAVCTSTNTGTLAIQDATSGTNTVVNSLVAFAAGTGIYMLNTHGNVYGCTVVKTGSAGGTGITTNNYKTRNIKNTAIFNVTTAISNTTGSLSASYNATSTASLPGSNNQTSLTFASQFASTTTDFRAIDTGSLDLNGTPDATNTPTDISGTTRDATLPTIGCWEVVATSTFLAKSNLITNQSVQLASTW